MPRRQSRGFLWRVTGIFALALLPTIDAFADDELHTARSVFRTGRYERVLELCDAAIAEDSFSEDWWLLKLQALQALGEYDTARTVVETATKRMSTSIRLKWVAAEILRMNDEPQLAEAALQQIVSLARRWPWQFNAPANRIILGRYFLTQQADPRQVLKVFYDPLKKDHPDDPQVYRAAGDLALTKHDYGLAAQNYRKALELDAGDPQTHFHLAEALAPSDPEAAEQAIRAALKLNPRHVDSLLFLVDHQIDAENYVAARQLLREVGQVNPEHPQAWAYETVLGYLDNDPLRESYCRRVALGWWTNNPQVDHLIGRKLSQKYRFLEGSEYQHRALAFDVDYLPAKMQLAQDLLRLGHEEVGWTLARSVYDKDEYNVVAHNLMQLQKRLEQFTTLESEGLSIRMDAGEAEIYGPRVVRLLERARDHLTEKYDAPLVLPVIVEIFPEQPDFAIRTFGLPGGEGFLGVCFGRVITANSPASQGTSPANWESVLWHEFCHVVTLQKTRNRIPRWLSEGLSVYEELQQNRGWGQSLTPRYREMILGEDLTPVSQLSAAFLNPASPEHLQFAYFESALVVEFLVESFGFDVIKQVLDDLARGLAINDALARHTLPLRELDEAFANFARNRAENLAPELDWEKPELPRRPDRAALTRLSGQHPDNYYVLKAQAAERLAAEDWVGATEILEELDAAWPEDAGGDGILRMLARGYQRRDMRDAELAVLNRLVELDGAAFDARLRLARLAAADQDWATIRRHAEAALAINPLLPEPHRHLAQAAEALDDPQTAIDAWRVLLVLDPTDPVDNHFRLAQLLHQLRQNDAARLHILQALELAPRFREGLDLLLKIHAARTSEKDPVPPPDSTNGDRPAASPQSPSDARNDAEPDVRSENSP